MTLNPHRRLFSVTQTITIRQRDGEHKFDISLAYGENDGILREIAFVGRGKSGHGLDGILTDLGIGLSRMIQGRHPETGDKL